MDIVPEKILSELIRSIHPTRRVMKRRRRVLPGRAAAEAGIACEIIEPAEGRGSLIARFGSGPKKLLYMSHLDGPGRGRLGF